MSDENQVDIPIRKESSSSSSVESRFIFGESSDPIHIQQSQQEPFLAEDNKNNFHNKSNRLKNHVEKSIDQTLDYSSNYLEETSMNPLNDQSSTYNILDQSMNDGDPLSYSDNETHSHLLPNDNQISNTDHQSKAQRQLDEEDIPPADMKLNEIPIQNDNNNNNNNDGDDNDRLTIGLLSNSADNFSSTKYETSFEHHSIQDESIIDQTETSSTESKSSSEENNSSIEYEKLNENQSTVDKTKNSSTESEPDSNDSSHLNQSEEQTENDNENNIISDEPLVDEAGSKTNLIENHSSHESDIEDEDEDEQSVNIPTGESTESDSSSTEDSHSVESEKSNENNNQNDISLIESTVDEAKNISKESESNSIEESPFDNMQKQNEDVDEHDISSDDLIIDQTGNILTELQSNISDNHSLVNLERTNESDNSLVDSTVDQTKNISTECESNSIEDLQSAESEKSNEDNNQNGIPLVATTVVDETNKSSIESESILTDNDSSRESENENRNDNPLMEPIFNETNSSTTEFQSNSIENLPLIQSEKSNEDNYENGIHLEEPTDDQAKNNSIESESTSIDDPHLTESEKSNEDDNNNSDCPLVEKTVDETNNSSTESGAILTDNNSSRESEKENENPNKRTEINNSLKSCLLPDVANEIVKENHSNSTDDNIEFENESIEQVNIQNGNHFVEKCLTSQLIDTDNRLEIKSNNLNNEDNEKQSSVSNSKLNPSEFEDILGNKSLLKQTTVTGESDSRPTRSTMATVSYKLSIIDSLTSNIHLIENVSKERFFISECDIIGAIDICVQSMNRGECALINCDIRHCYGEMGCHEKQIPAISTNNSYRMLIELELHDWQSPPDIRKLSIDERLYWGDKKRHMGNFHYRRQDNSTALQCYNGALRFLNTDLNPILISFDENQRLILNDRYIQVENNVAQVNLLLKNYDVCLNAVENVLKHDPNNVKALFRQGKAFFQLGLYDKAIPPLKLFMQIQKGNSNATVDKEKVTEMIQTCENKLAHYEKSEKEIYQRMFRPKTTASSPSNQQRQTKATNQIDNRNASWWPYVALGSAVLATVALVTFIKHRKIS
ncbi:unnamed protein product [Rotaria socialis]|uniref:Peptidylprolyl isomerase n=1 Tax=Rotaria socialis TaxID=392032 RepID=A0A818DJJ0_9BILA|nr:unnamed protein product [Rotaria socialis]CAF3691792.1 unnamed protein product [Rotaria socialis]CAF4500087.1 unnamed protein product [Rotaria socialis]CAF4525862.1 unnamed protein product [Rotaria socialis]